MSGFAVIYHLDGRPVERATLERIERDALAQIVVQGASERNRTAAGMPSGENAAPKP